MKFSRNFAKLRWEYWDFVKSLDFWRIPNEWIPTKCEQNSDDFWQNSDGNDSNDTVPARPNLTSLARTAGCSSATCSRGLRRFSARSSARCPKMLTNGNSSDREWSRRAAAGRAQLLANSGNCRLGAISESCKSWKTPGGWCIFSNSGEIPVKFRWNFVKILQNFGKISKNQQNVDKFCQNFGKILEKKLRFESGAKECIL